MLNSDFQHRRVVIYARVSTEHEAQISALENQIDWYKPILAARPEWELVGQYIDEGITGTSAEKRPQFMKMISDAMKRKFDLIITREVSRFARNTVDTLQYTRKLKEKGVEVFFINDNIKTMDGDGELRLTLMATFAQDESRKTSIRVKSGQQTSMENGVVYGTGNILGYDRVGKEMVINPEQAKVVRMIFDWYLQGWGLVKIKNELELRRIPTSTGKDHWHPTVISHVLRNSFYCGIMTYHKEYTPDYLQQKKIKNRGAIPMLQVQGTHEPIVTVEEYERVQTIMESKRKTLPGREGRKCGKSPITTMWGRLLICECGHKFNRRTWNRGDRWTGNAYQCYSSIHTGSYSSRKKRGLSLDGICQSPMVPEWRLQMMANLIFREYLQDRDKVLSLANSILEAHFEEEQRPEADEQALNDLLYEVALFNFSQFLIRDFDLQKMPVFGKGCALKGIRRGCEGFGEAVQHGPISTLKDSPKEQTFSRDTEDPLTVPGQDPVDRVGKLPGFRPVVDCPVQGKTRPRPKTYRPEPRLRLLDPGLVPAGAKGPDQVSLAAVKLQGVDAVFFKESVDLVPRDPRSRRGGKLPFLAQHIQQGVISPGGEGVARRRIDKPIRKPASVIREDVAEGPLGRITLVQKVQGNAQRFGLLFGRGDDLSPELCFRADPVQLRRCLAFRIPRCSSGARPPALPWPPRRSPTPPTAYHKSRREAEGALDRIEHPGRKNSCRPHRFHNQISIRWTKGSSGRG